MFMLFPGPVRRLRLVNKAGQPPSGWDAIPQWQLKTSSHCQGIFFIVTELNFWPFIWHTHCNTTALTELCEFELWTKCLFEDHFHQVKLVIISLNLVFLHSNCSEGTCDGCTFHFLWESQHACPLCTKNHYREIVSACIQGIQVVDVLTIIIALPQHYKSIKRSITDCCCVARNT